MNPLIKKLLSPRKVEYLVISDNCLIADFSLGLERFADTKAAIDYHQDARHYFPELIGLESIMHHVKEFDTPLVEMKSICRRSSLYFDLSLLAEKNDQFLLLFEDVTYRVQLEQTLSQRTNETLLLNNALTEARDYLQQVIHVMGNLLLVIDQKYLIKTINYATQCLFGYEEAELIGKPITILFPELLNLYPREVEMLGRTKEGASIHISVSCTPSHNGKEWVLCGRDITEQKQSEEKLKAALESKRLFLAKMSHELRSPLNSILGFTEILIKKEVPENKCSEYLAVIQRNSEYLLSQINDILTFSSIEEGRISLVEHSFSITHFLHLLEETFQMRARKKELHLLFHYPMDFPSFIYTDEQKLWQILSNLLDNAIKFTHQGEVSLSVNFDPIDDILGTLYFVIQDSGVGISPDDIHTIFSPFTQGDAGNKLQQGSGLGLAICSAFLQIMRGEITVSSQLGLGTTFVVCLPVYLAFSDREEIFTCPLPAREEDAQDLSRLIQVLPGQWLKRLRRAAQLGNDDSIRHLIATLPPEHDRIAHKLQAWSDDYRFDRILQCLNDITEPGLSHP